jgi:hypothetical protein
MSGSGPNHPTRVWAGPTVSIPFTIIASRYRRKQSCSARDKDAGTSTEVVPWKLSEENHELRTSSHTRAAR